MAADLVTETEAKNFPGIEDVDLKNLIDQASAQIRSMVGRPIIQEEVTEFVKSMGDDELLLTYYPVKTGSVTLTDRKNDQTLTDFFLVEDEGILVKKDGIWPEGQRRFQATYTAGMAANTETVPADLKKAALLLIRNEQDGTAQGMSSESIADYSYSRFDDAGRVVYETVEKLVAPYTVIRL